MRVVKSFEEFMREGVVKKISPDTQRAADLYQESERKFHSLQKIIKHMGVEDATANDYVEYGYNIILFMLRAKMLERGYASSGQGAHEAEVAFARTLHLNEADILFLDQLRYFRNGILYYGKRLDAEYARQIIKFTTRVYNYLKQHA